MLVNNSSNISKTENHLSSYNTEHKKTTRYEVGNLSPGLEQAQEKFEDVNEKISCKSQDWQYNAQTKEKKQYRQTSFIIISQI